MTWKDDALSALDNAAKAMELGWSEQEQLNVTIGEQQAKIAEQQQTIVEQQNSINVLMAEVERLTKLLEAPDDMIPTGGRIVPTFECLSVYWNPPPHLAHHALIPIRFAEVDGVWLRGFDLRYDERDLVDPASGQKLEKARGSIVGLKPDTHYLVQFGLYATAQTDELITWVAQQDARTWSEEINVTSTRQLGSGQQPVVITQGGTAEGFVAYDGGGTATIDVKKQADDPIVVNASYVVIRRVKLAGGRIGCVFCGPGVHDVWIEKSELTDWGTRDKVGKLGAYGVDYQGAIRNGSIADGSSVLARMKETKRIVIQRCVIHDPTYGTNDWTEGHPSGPCAWYMRNSGGNNVFRYNECFATEKDPRKVNKYFNDCLGALDNAGPGSGFPGADSDIYQNDLKCAMDDMVELEGMGCNVRAWGNRMDFGGASWFGTNVVHEGPTYIWRNVTGQGRMEWTKPADQAMRTGFHKTGDHGTIGNGLRFVFHNTTFSPPSSEGSVPMGLQYAASDVSVGIHSLYHRNNIWQLARNKQTYELGAGDHVSLDYEMTSSQSWGQTLGNSQPHGLFSKIPVFKPGHGYGSNGAYELADGSPGKNVGEVIYNFNADSFNQSGPDFGAHEGGTMPMTFGVLAKRP